MKKQLFNQDWCVCRGTGSPLSILLGTDGAGTPEQVTLPHDAMIHTERVEKQEYAGMGFYQGEDINYTKNFKIPATDYGKAVWLEFEGIYQNASVYLNSSFVGRCVYGYGNYYFDITRLIRYGENNQIHIIVRNKPLSGRWYTGGGIYRDVYLMIGEPLHIPCEGIRVTTEEADKEVAALFLETPIEYIGYEPKDCIVLNEILDAEGNVVTSDSVPVTVREHGKTGCTQRISVENPQLWNVDTPYLYTCRTTLLVKGEVLDTAETTFGIRKLSLDAVYGLRINGTQVKLRGGCVHHDSGILGAATFRQAEERRVRKLKNAGYNAIRSAHQPMSRAMLDACDRIGMLVMDEFSDAWTTTKADYDYGCVFDQNWELDVTNMVNKAYNHPCVILYSLGNEIAETGDKFDVGWGKKIADKIRSLDSTRYLTICVNLLVSVLAHADDILKDMDALDVDGPKEINTMMTKLGEHMGEVLEHPLVTAMTEEAFSLVDVAGYNYAANRYEADSKKFKNRIMVGSETWPITLADNWAQVEKNPKVIGDFSWTAWDYLGEVGCGKVTYEEESASSFFSKWPWRSANSGDFDLIGDRRPISYWREIVWGLRKQPYISVRPPKHYGETPIPSLWSWISDSIESWNWPGYEEKPITVEVFSNAEEVELFVNGVSVGTQKVGTKTACCAVFDTVYHPGEVKAVDNLGEEYTILSAKNADFLKLEADRTKLLTGGQQIAFVEISLCDEDGTLNCGAETEITVDVSGAGTLQAVGSAAPITTENLNGVSCRTWQGRALAVVRSGMEKGDIVVSVCTKEGIKETITLQAVYQTGDDSHLYR